MKSLLLVLATALLMPHESALAQVAAVVEGVQMPAWIERDGRRLPLIPGMELRPGDQLVTGAGSRVMVKLAEGSLVRLGEKGQLRFTELSPSVAKKYGITHPVCLYSERNLFMLLLDAGASVLRTLTTTYGNVKGVAVRV
jgi:hypothetical protein